MNPPLTAELVHAWNGLAQQAGTLPTQDAAWAQACFDCLPGEARPIVVGEAGAPAAIAPLVQRDGVLEMAGSRDLGEPGDLLFRSPTALGELAAAIAAAGRPLSLNRLPTGSPTVAAVREAFGNCARVRSGDVGGHPVILLGDCWTEPGGGLSPSRRSSLRRARRRAERTGAIEVQALTPATAEIPELLDEAFAIEARSWKREAGTAIALLPAMEAFFRRYATDLGARGLLRIDFLRIDGRAVAMQLGARWKNRHWLFKIGYDEAFAAASPGQLLLAESIASAARNGLESYELLGSADGWTAAWTKEVRPCLALLAIPRSARGMLGLATIRRHQIQQRAYGVARDVKGAARRRATSRYVAGPELGDALRVEAAYSAAGYATAVGFWNRTADSPQRARSEAFAIAAALPAGREVAVKLPALGGDGAHLDELLGVCGERELTLHLDALAPDTATLCQEAAGRMHAIAGGGIGCTLPGRWYRSLADAEALRDRGMRVRVVKGEIAGPAEDERDPRAGFLAVVASLRGGSCHVEVATHDAAVAASALRQLTEAGTSCELQVLHGVPSRAAVGAARALAVPVRVYVPYGAGRLPYARDDLRARPRLAAALVRDLLPLPPRRPRGVAWRQTLSEPSAAAPAALGVRPPGRPA